MRIHSVIRLFVTAPLKSGSRITLDKPQTHYIANVMRRKVSETVNLFNGTDGEYSAEIVDISKHNVTLQVRERTKEQRNSPDITLIYAPVKNARNEFIVQKATEMGVNNIQPVITKHTIKDKTNTEKLNLVAIEAAEQCERLDIPAIHEIDDLENILRKYSAHTIILCDETGKGEAASEVLPKIKGKGKYAIVIGPEGGFSDLEISIMNSMKNVHPIGIGPRILRADTAIITALALVQNYLGDLSLLPEFRG